MRYGPKDRVGLVIASGLVGTMFIMIISITIRNRTMSESSGEIFLAIATGLTTALGAYFASRNNGNGK